MKKLLPRLSNLLLLLATQVVVVSEAVEPTGDTNHASNLHGTSTNGTPLPGTTPPSDGLPDYQDHQQLSYFLTVSGERHAVQTAADWLVRRDHVLQHVARVMGPLPSARFAIPLDLRVEQRDVVPVEPRDGVPPKGVTSIERRKVTYCTDMPQPRIAAWLLVPQGVPPRRPAMLCLHQTVQVGKDEPAGVAGSPELDYALELAAQGFVTLAPDYPSLGESRHDFDQDRFVSGSMKAIYDNVRALDLLQSLPEVDPDRIGCIGHSLGGHNSIFTAVFDPRVKVIVSSCGFTRFHKYYQGDLTGWSGPRYMPKIGHDYDRNPDKVPFDFPELLGALAPRPMLAVAPLHDANFEVSGVRESIAAASTIYELFGVPDFLVAHYPDCEHAFPAAEREFAYQFLRHHLRCTE